MVHIDPCSFVGEAADCVIFPHPAVAAGTIRAKMHFFRSPKHVEYVLFLGFPKPNKTGKYKLHGPHATLWKANGASQVESVKTNAKSQLILFSSGLRNPL